MSLERTTGEARGGHESWSWQQLKSTGADVPRRGDVEVVLHSLRVCTKRCAEVHHSCTRKHQNSQPHDNRRTFNPTTLQQGWRSDLVSSWRRGHTRASRQDIHSTRAPGSPGRLWMVHNQTTAHTPLCVSNTFTHVQDPSIHLGSEINQTHTRTTHERHKHKPHTQTKHSNHTLMINTLTHPQHHTQTRTHTHTHTQTQLETHTRTQFRHELPPEFHLTLPSSGVVNHLSGPYPCALC